MFYISYLWFSIVRVDKVTMLAIDVANKECYLINAKYVLAGRVCISKEGMY